MKRAFPFSLVLVSVVFHFQGRVVLGQNETSPTEENQPDLPEAAPGLYDTRLPESLFTTRLYDLPHGVLGMGSLTTGPGGGPDPRVARMSDTGHDYFWYYGRAGQASQLGAAQTNAPTPPVMGKTNSVAPPGTQTLINTQTNGIPTSPNAVYPAVAQPDAGGTAAGGTRGK